jgi:hypothetical protein
MIFSKAPTYLHKERVMPQTSFAQVKEILDRSIADWMAENGRDPDLLVHGDSFGWDTKVQLAAADAFGIRLIDPAMVGNGKGHQTALVIALATGVPGFPRMPIGGPFLPDHDIATIARWIDEGMPD